MVLKVLKRVLTGLLVLVVICVLLFFTPRIISALRPGAPPVGYHFESPVYLAVWSGLEKLADLKPEIPPEIEELKDIEYKNVDGKPLQLDIYRPTDLTGPAPLLVFIHGGSWKGGKRSDYLVYLVAFAQRGYVTATVSYRLLGDAPYPACIEDINDAVRWLCANGENYGYDPERIALIGGSAGGHLAMLSAYGWGDQSDGEGNEFTGNNKCPVRAVVNIYGPSDLTTEYARSHRLVTDLVAYSFEEAPHLYSEASPVYYLDRNDPPTLIFHGTSDRLVPVSQSDNLKAMLDSLDVPAVYHRLPLWPHTMDVVKRVNEFCQEKMTEFFEEYL